MNVPLGTVATWVTRGRKLVASELVSSDDERSA